MRIAQIPKAILREVASGRIVRAAAPALLGGLCGVLVATPATVDGTPDRRVGSASTFVIKKQRAAFEDPPPLLTTLAVVHTGERVAFDAKNPSDSHFSELLADRVTGETKALDPRLCELLRKIATDFPGGRIELVSGYRSEKLNEVLRKKGHHVATHSQHSLGNAVDFRVLTKEMADAPHTPDDLPIGVDPRVMEKKIRDLGWVGGVGVYAMPRDWFVHADVGPNRRWWGT
jgi:uncharacterized protein YcbK (DUF882 family)